jgi:hypothetical protein
MLGAVVCTSPGNAHEARGVGNHELEVGWLREPAFAGSENAVQVAVTHASGPEAGEPATEADLEVDVLFGGRDASESTGSVPLEPAIGTPGEYRAAIIPTRPGQYTFHITGDIEGQQVDEFFSSGPDSFSDVEDPASLQFPARDPSSGQLAEAVTRLQAREAVLRTATEDARRAASTARLVAITGLTVAAISMVLAGMALRRRRARL